MGRTTRLVLGCVLAIAGTACTDSGECARSEVITESELRYVDLECGDLRTAERGDVVTVHYTGRLSSGEEFDSSLGAKPLTFKIGSGDAIAGWEEGIPGMQIGGIRELTVPPHLGYGDSGYPPVIPPDATLTFEIELLGVNAYGL